MRKLHILIPSILIASTIPMVSMVGCNKQPEPEVVHVTRVEIAQESKNINVWKEDSEHQKIKYTVFPNNATDKSVRWTVDPSDVATVADDGTITPLKVGEAEITISTKDGGFVDKCNLKVQNVGSISIVQGDTIAYLGHPKQLTYEITPANSVEAINVTWESSNTDIATIDNNGWITPKAVGDTTITVKIENTDISDQCILTILEPEPLCFEKDGTTSDPNPTIGYATNTESLDIDIETTYTPDDEDSWINWDKNTPIELHDNEKLYVRNTKDHLSVPTGGHLSFTTSTDGKIKASGNVDSMINYSELKPSCYSAMFYDCTALTTAPDLPATTLADSCYGQMFFDCTSLIKAPELPAKTVTDWCYGNMFAYCSSLTEVPGLPATTLAEGCYMYMFAYCSSLTEVPDLPAPTLAERCYKNMFFYCSALKIKQQDTKIEDEGFIFTCPNEYPEGAVSGMFNYISSESEFKGNPQPGKSYYWYIDQTEEPLTFTATSDGYFAVEHMEYEVEWETPNLEYSIDNGEWEEYDLLTYPQIELESGQKIRLRGDNSDGFNYVESSAKYSYYSFYFYITGNISGNIMSLLSPDFDDLDEIPCPGCFYRLFYNSSIINASELILPASQLEPHCYDSMFLRCNLLTHSPKELPATTLDDCCYEFMFEHCASLTTTPTLPAETLAPSCYDWMFYDCTSLSIKQQDTKTVDDGFIFTCPTDLPWYAVDDMFGGCKCFGFDETPEEGKSYYWFEPEVKELDFTQYEVEPTPYPVLESQEFFIDETAIYKLNIDLSCTKGDLNYYHYGELSWINHQYIPVDVNVEILNYVCDGRKLSFDPESEIPDKEDTYCYNEVMYDCIAMYQDSLTKTSKIEIELIFIDSSEITELVQFGFVNLGPSSNITAYA